MERVPERDERKMVVGAWIRAAVGIAVLTVLGLCGSGCDDELRYHCAEPLAPVGVTSITGDQAVRLAWIPVDERGVDYFVVYRARTPGGTYYEVGHTGKDAFTDTDVRNGETYFYAVTAVNHCGDESDLSWEIAQDTPRPEGFARLYDAAGNAWDRSGWDFDRYRALPWDAAEADVYFVVSEGLPYLVAVDLQTDIQDAGYAGFDVIGWAPDGGWSPSGTVEVIEGHTYVVWTRNNHYAKLRVTDVNGSRVEFDWGYQVDTGNPELKPGTGRSPGPESGFPGPRGPVS